MPWCGSPSANWSSSCCRTMTGRPRGSGGSGPVVRGSSVKEVADRQLHRRNACGQGPRRRRCGPGSPHVARCAQTQVPVGAAGRGVAGSAIGLGRGALPSSPDGAAHPSRRSCPSCCRRRGRRPYVWILPAIVSPSVPAHDHVDPGGVPRSPVRRSGGGRGWCRRPRSRGRCARQHTLIEQRAGQRIRAWSERSSRSERQVSARGSKPSTSAMRRTDANCAVASRLRAKASLPLVTSA